jgi:DNA-binding transcriptional regulator YhcF (GntR family)
LRAEGFLAVHKREGVIVRRREEMAAPEGFERRLRAELEPSAAEAICRSLDEVAFLKVCAEVYRLIQGGRQT